MLRSLSLAHLVAGHGGPHVLESQAHRESDKGAFWNRHHDLSFALRVSLGDAVLECFAPVTVLAGPLEWPALVTARVTAFSA